jgi:maltose alpha-D-glucosyltransferase/alpha-amylase
MDTKYPDRMLLAEANQWPGDAVEYFGEGDESHMNYHFPLMPRLFLALARSDRGPIEWILDRTPEIPTSAQWGIFLRNHDELTLEMVTEEERAEMYAFYARDPRAKLNVGIRRRLAPLLDNDPRRLRLMFSLLLGLPGSPFIYYGDELGMGDDLKLPDRDGVRTPMQWDGSRNGGFSTSSETFAPIIDDDVFGYRAVNVAAAVGDESSLWHWIRKAIAIRQRHPAFGRGSVEFLRPSDSAVLAFALHYEQDSVVVVANLSDSVRRADVGVEGIDEFSGTRYTGQPLEIEPYGYRWITRLPVGGEGA